MASSRPRTAMHRHGFDSSNLSAGEGVSGSRPKCAQSSCQYAHAHAQRVVERSSGGPLRVPHTAACMHGGCRRAQGNVRRVPSTNLLVQQADGYSKNLRRGMHVVHGLTPALDTSIHLSIQMCNVQRIRNSLCFWHIYIYIYSQHFRASARQRSLNGSKHKE